MTAGTLGLFHRIAAVGLLEGSLIAFMTGKAELRFRPGQQALLVGAVGGVAGSASLFGKGGMLDLEGKGGLVVARIAELGSVRGLEQIGGVGPMGVVAGNAFAGLERGVDILFVHAETFLAVALVTERIARLLEEQLGYPAVTQVALLAFPSLDHGMDALLVQVGTAELLMTIQTSFGGESALRPGRTGESALRLGRTGEGRQPEAENRQSTEADNRPVCLLPETHGSSSYFRGLG